ncbi:MAG: diaminopimelate decarboxylase [Candidatus Magasanikbacteria bacterium]|jgi:diaminopimelate decarboxylase|nr:diaminopimelate decarboxylase [Candidatus Magasanikbacteria bacterium]MBT4071225.1 diaminopimelate decarboxylase [Candidatus Magasanikbacteria bacterium]
MQLTDNNYYIGKQKVEGLCEQFGSPLYVYDATVIRERIAELKEGIGKYENADFFYAIKANYNPSLVKEIIGQGLGIDAVSVEEVHMALHCGATPDRILYTGNNMTDKEMTEVHELGVLLNIGSLSRLEKYGRAFSGSRVSIRFNPNIGIASHETNITGGADSKFGISFKNVEKVKEIAKEHNLQIVGIHQHIGSGWLRLREPILALDVILDIATQFEGLEFVDVGGGFGVPYRPEESRLDMNTLGMQIDRRFESFCETYGAHPVLRFEPGRYIVAESCFLLTQVNTIKESISRKIIVGTDTGMNHLVRTAMYGSYHPITNISNPDGMFQEYDITGNICECSDFFARDRMMHEVRDNDILSIGVAGAYGASMASNYQLRGLPTEILVDGDDVQVIRKRETFEDLLARF